MSTNEITSHELDQILEGKNPEKSESRLLLDKISLLTRVLEEFTLDSEQALLKSELYFSPVVKDRDREIVTKKLLQLIGKM